MCSKIGGGCVLSLLLDTNGGGGGTLQRVKINLGGSLGLVLEVCTILNGAPFGQNFIYYGAPFQAEMRTQGCVITWQLCYFYVPTRMQYIKKALLFKKSCSGYHT